MIVCVVSDSHDDGARLRSALAAAHADGARAALHCGDLVDADTLAGLEAGPLPLHVVHGNNRGNVERLHAIADRAGSGIRYYGEEADFPLAGRRVFLSHYPERARSAALTGRWSLVCCGHSHRAEIRTVSHANGAALLVNPGTVAGIGAQPTYAIGDLATLEFEIRALEPAS